MVDPSSAFNCSNRPRRSHETRLRRVLIWRVWGAREMSGYRKRGDWFLRRSSRGKRNVVAIASRYSCEDSRERLFIPQETNFTTLRYKGNFWSRMKGSRDKGRSFEGPGPGYYDHETKKTPAQICDEKIKERKRGAATQLRFLDVLYRQKLREVTLRMFSAKFHSPGTAANLFYP